MCANASISRIITVSLEHQLFSSSWICTVLLKIRLCFRIWLPQAISVLKGICAHICTAHCTKLYDWNPQKFLPAVSAFVFFFSVQQEHLRISLYYKAAGESDPQNKQELQFQPGTQAWSPGGQQGHPLQDWAQRGNRITALQDRGNAFMKLLPECLNHWDSSKTANFQKPTACEFSLCNLSSLVRDLGNFAGAATEFSWEQAQQRHEHYGEGMVTR